MMVDKSAQGSPVSIFAATCQGLPGLGGGIIVESLLEEMKDQLYYGKESIRR